MEKHTPGPWRTAERSGFPFHIDDARGESVAVMLADEDHDEHRGLENARRIVACVNACSGIPTDLLEAISEFEKSGMQTINSVMHQRDKLLEALEKVTAKLAWLNSDDCGHIMALTDEAEAIIASIKGGKS